MSINEALCGGLAASLANRRHSTALVVVFRHDVPVRLPERNTFSSVPDVVQPGQALYEPFCVSGTTIIAAEITGRACHAIELLGQYVDVAVERWQAFTGSEARLESDGRSFQAVTEERRQA